MSLGAPIDGPLVHAGGPEQIPARTWRLCLLALFVLAFLVRLACFTGLVGSDDVWYATYAQQIASGEYPSDSNQYTGRPGVFLPVALIYRLFGTSEASSVIVPLFASSASVGLVAAIGARLFGPLAGLIAGLLLCSSPIHIRHASILMPEPIMEFWIALGVWCYLRAASRGSRLLAAAAGVAIGVAYLTKEPAVFVVPALMAAAWIARRRDLAAAVALGALAVAGVELAAYQLIYGDPLHRLVLARVAVPANLYNRFEFNAQPWVAERLFKAYPRRMLLPNVSFGLHYIVGIVMGMVGFVYQKRSRLLLVLWAALPWAFLNFATTSLTQYLPSFPSDRYISMTLPPLFILGAGALAVPSAWQRTLKGGLGVPLLGALMLVGLGCGLWTKGTGWNTAEIAGLRMVLRKAAERGERVCDHTVVDPHGDFRARLADETWKATLRTLGPHLLQGPGEPGLVLERDALGLPIAREGVCGTTSGGRS